MEHNQTKVLPNLGTNPKIFRFQNYSLVDSDQIKLLRSEDYNYNFNKTTGYFERWGINQTHNPFKSFFGPEIADIEITTICNGPGGKLCPFCYKGNTNTGHNMTIDEFKKIFHKIPKTLTQIAFGADAGGITNPDLFKMMEYCRTNDYNQVIPNITVADITDEIADKLASLAGAVAVSFYKHAGKDYCYDSIKKLTDRGMAQINIHYVLSQETVYDIDELITDIQTDDRLKGLNAVVFLSLKTKARGEKYLQCTQEQFTEVIKKCFESNIPHGCDSCSAIKYNIAIADHPRVEELKTFIEPCESTKFSLYINEKGKVFPCSFMENTKDFWDQESGYDMLDDSFISSSADFLDKIWNGERFTEFGMKTTMCNTCNEGCQYYVI